MYPFLGCENGALTELTGARIEHLVGFLLQIVGAIHVAAGRPEVCPVAGRLQDHHVAVRLLGQIRSALVAEPVRPHAANACLLTKGSKDDADALAGETSSPLGMAVDVDEEREGTS